MRLVSETAAEQGQRFGAVTRVARQLDIGAEWLRLWVGVPGERVVAALFVRPHGRPGAPQA